MGGNPQCELSLIPLSYVVTVLLPSPAVQPASPHTRPESYSVGFQLWPAEIKLITRAAAPAGPIQPFLLIMVSCSNDLWKT